MWWTWGRNLSSSQCYGGQNRDEFPPWKTFPKYCVQFWASKTSKALICWNNFSRGPSEWSGVGALALWGQTKGDELVQPGEEMAWWDLAGFFQYDRECYWEDGARVFMGKYSGSARDNDHKLKQNIFIRYKETGYEENTLTIRIIKYWNRDTGRVWNLCPWRFSRPAWAKCWANWSELSADPTLSRWLD